MVFFIWPSSDETLFSVLADAIAFFSKKATFGGSYLGYVKAGTCGARAYYGGVKFISMIWLGITGAPTGYVGIVVIA